MNETSGTGRTLGPETAQDAGTPLPSRPARAKANNAKAKIWKTTPMENACSGDTDMKGHLSP